MNTSAKLEALLFFRGEPTKKKKLCELLGVKEKGLKEATNELREALTNRGLSLVETDEVLELRTSTEASDLIEKITKEELSKDLGKAGIETLSIIIYNGPVSKKDIDYVRGVNSSFIIRNLMIRGLVDRVVSKNDARSFVYRPTTELLSFLGIEKVENMPEYQNVTESISNFYEHSEDSTD
ncbi:MAG: SMC-Scp complex subunit ScpB [Candidatus Pacebacteria bacterium]|nr:SMC-Scp complex subunit ScpB [Candidatus Paceibacterota bacterium]